MGSGNRLDRNISAKVFNFPNLLGCLLLRPAYIRHTRGKRLPANTKEKRPLPPGAANFDPNLLLPNAYRNFGWKPRERFPAAETKRLANHSNNGTPKAFSNPVFPVWIE